MFCSKCGSSNTNEAKFCTSCGAIISSTTASFPQQPVFNQPPQPQYAYTPQPQMQQIYAGFWLRFAAALIDGIILAIAGGIMGSILAIILHPSTRGSIKDLQIVVQFFSFILGWLYFTVLESSAQQGTLGKRLIGLKVTDLSGNRISFGRANGRYFAKIISAIILLIGYIMAAFTERKQALHDMMSSCLIVKK